ncbi:hypothetical protein CJ20_168 [Escherichia phage CJ20]|nr:hypothetical protein CJ20_168 [Escherichia phage CJ20]
MRLFGLLSTSFNTRGSYAVTSSPAIPGRSVISINLLISSSLIMIPYFFLALEVLGQPVQEYPASMFERIHLASLLGRHLAERLPSQQIRNYLPAQALWNLQRSQDR